MNFGRLWAGHIFGTNTGKLFLKFEDGEHDGVLKGVLRASEPELGIAVYTVGATFDGQTLNIAGLPQISPEAEQSIRLGQLKARGSLLSDGSVKGEWETTIGTAGTFVLFPHSLPDTNTASGTPEPVYTARHTFGPIEIDRDQVISLAQEIQRGFSNGKVVITFSLGTEQSRFLEDFQQMRFNPGKAEVLRLFVQEQEQQGSSRSISVEFGPYLNVAMAQSVSESWALGELERLKREIKRYERVYAAKKFGIGVNQLMAVGTIVFLPSLANLKDRAILAGGVVALIYAVIWMHGRYLPHAAIWLRA